MAQARIHKELYQLLDYPLSGIFINTPPCGGPVQKLTGYLIGPQGSVYEGGRFEIQIILKRYPFVAPVVKFKTKIYHPNVSLIGQISYRPFYNQRRETQWCPVKKMSFILLGIQHLFTDIDPENFMEPYIGMQYQKDSQSFDKIAKEWVNKYST